MYQYINRFFGIDYLVVVVSIFVHSSKAAKLYAMSQRSKVLTKKRKPKFFLETFCYCTLMVLIFIKVNLQMPFAILKIIQL